jgi:hypothetical protein
LKKSVVSQSQKEVSIVACHADQKLLKSNTKDVTRENKRVSFFIVIE